MGRCGGVATGSERSVFVGRVASVRAALQDPNDWLYYLPRMEGCGELETGTAMGRASNISRAAAIVATPVITNGVR